jgi:RHS repeat-associated protein
MAYEPFGDNLVSTGVANSVYGFTGEWADPTSLIHLRARYYNPTDARFLQPDPFNGVPFVPSSQHAYQYGYNNPLRFTDPSGEQATGGGVIAIQRVAPEPEPQPETEPLGVDIFPPLKLERSEPPSVLSIYRKLGGRKSNDKSYYRKPKTSASEFRLDADGASAFDLEYLLGDRPYAIRFDVNAKRPVSIGSTNQIIGLPCTATFDNIEPGHWGVFCTPLNETPHILSKYAQGTGIFNIIINPNWNGEPKDVRLPW